MNPSLRTLPSGRIQARYTGPDGMTHTAPVTFDTKGDAETWLATVRTDMVRGLWNPTDNAKPMTFEDYANAWLADRTLKPRTRAHYRSLLDRLIAPTFGPFALKAITPEAVRRWHAETGTTRPTLRAHAYGLLRTVLASAVQDQLTPRTHATSAEPATPSASTRSSPQPSPSSTSSSRRCRASTG